MAILVSLVEPWTYIGCRFDGNVGLQFHHQFTKKMYTIWSVAIQIHLFITKSVCIFLTACMLNSKFSLVNSTPFGFPVHSKLCNLELYVRNKGLFAKVMHAFHCNMCRVVKLMQKACSSSIPCSLSSCLLRVVDSGIPFSRCGRLECHLCTTAIAEVLGLVFANRSPFLRASDKYEFDDMQDGLAKEEDDCIHFIITTTSSSCWKWMENNDSVVAVFTTLVNQGSNLQLVL